VLVRADGDGCVVIGQLSHSWLAGQLARAWGNAEFGAVELREEVILGAQQHDIGWARFDSKPLLNPDTGWPRSFLELGVEDHLSIWHGAPELLLSQSTGAALVVSLHSSSLSELRLRGAPEDARVLQTHIDEEHARQAELCDALGLTHARAERIRQQMWAWDGISLALCNAWRPFTVSQVPAADGLTTIELLDRDDRTSTVDPWPFNMPRVELQCEARRLERRCEDEAGLRRALAQAAPLKLGFVLCR
jgi:hypothetical protein